MSKSPQDKDFIREKIVKEPLTLKDWIFRISLIIGAAILFGVVSCLTFVELKPILEKKLSQEPESSALETMQSEETSAQETQQSKRDEQEVEVESIVNNYLEKNNSGLTKLAKRLSKSIVKVTTVTKDVDWFDSSYEKENTVSGIILDISNSEIQILTNYDMVKEADHVKVSFEDGKQVTAQVIALDKTSQLAMLSVPLTELEDGTIACINKVRMLETQSMMEKGSPVIILGSPNGNVGSMGLSYIMEIIEDVPIVDGAQMQINTDFSVLGSGVSGLFDLKGRLIGIYTNNSDEKTSNAISISSIQDEIDLLESQSSIACLGVYGQEVTKEIATTHNLPYGIYITNLVEKGAAYKSGLQNGDVITKIGETTVFNLQSLKSEILKRENKEEVQVTVQRSGAKGYKEIVLNVKLGKR